MRVPLLPCSCPFFFFISICLLFSSMYQGRDHVCVLCVQQEPLLLTAYAPCPDFALLKIHNQLNINSSPARKARNVPMSQVGWLKHLEEHCLARHHWPQSLK